VPLVSRYQNHVRKKGKQKRRRKKRLRPGLMNRANFRDFIDESNSGAAELHGWQLVVKRLPDLGSLGKIPFFSML